MKGPCSCGSCDWCNPDQHQCPECKTRKVEATGSGGQAIWHAMSCGNVLEVNMGTETWMDECGDKQVVIQYGDDPKVGKTEFTTMNAFLSKLGLRVTARQKVRMREVNERYGGSYHAPVD